MATPVVLLSLSSYNWRSLFIVTGGIGSIACLLALLFLTDLDGLAAEQRRLLSGTGTGDHTATTTSNTNTNSNSNNTDKTTTEKPSSNTQATASKPQLLIHTMLYDNNMQLLFLASTTAYFSVSLCVDWFNLYLIEYHNLTQVKAVELTVWLEVSVYSI